MRSKRIALLPTLLVSVLLGGPRLGADEPMERIQGPLRVHPANPRYFTNDTGRAILLTGSHTWNNLLDMEADGTKVIINDTDHLWGIAHPFGSRLSTG